MVNMIEPPKDAVVLFMVQSLVVGVVGALLDVIKYCPVQNS